MVRYKACCNTTCLVSRCETREAGGCYCVCRLVDQIHNLEQVIEGVVVGLGCIYLPSQEKRDAWFNGLSEEMKAKELQFRNVEARILLIRAKRELWEKTYG